ncbi:MAG: hypothetical protein COB85_09790, partial [Bacteroidetes bacterium]
FESGTSNWNLTNNWGLDSSNSNSATKSLTESPGGNYGDQETSYATMANPIDLSTVLDANVSFWAIYDIEGGFDYTYVEASGDGGTNWVNLATFDGENNLSPWIQYSYSLGGFVGSSNVIVRFRFVSDGAVNEDGMFIDDFELTSNSIDNSPPLILHTGPTMYEASLSDQNINAEIIDISGISLAELNYTLDGGAPLMITGVNTSGNNYLFVLPSQAAGTWVDYSITAIDASDSLNMATSDTSSYISGNYIVYDNATVNFVNSYGPGSAGGFPGAAVRITLAGTTNLVSSLIRNYTDVNRPNDSMLIHVWANAGGIPGTDLITPFMLYPEATLAQPNIITRVDLRPYSSQLSNISGDVFVGFTVPTGEVWLSQTTPGSAARTFVDSVTTWFGITDDYHFRAITDTFAGATVANYSYNSSGDPVITFADSSTNSPVSWIWDFGDGSGTSTAQNPGYTYTSNGTYNVCLTATNVVGSSTFCQWITITNVPTVASFSVSDTSFCEGACVDFTDMSTNMPTTWAWTFTGGTPSTGTTQNPTVCYNTPGTYDVRLIATNGGGPDTILLTAFITASVCPPPIAAFAASSTMICVGDAVTFTDQSTQSPLTWLWLINGATPSTDSTQNTTVVYNTPGSYDVTLVVANFSGVDSLTLSNYITVNALPATPTIAAGGPTEFCQGDNVTLTSSSTTGNTWSDASTTQTITVSTSGNYTVTVTDGNGCNATSATTTVTASASPATPTITASGPTTFCDGGSVVLTSSIAALYIWDTGDTTQSITIDSTGTYKVRITDSIGCNSAFSSIMSVTENPNPAVPNILQNVNVLTSDLATAYQWYMNSTSLSGETSQSYTITQDGTYTVEITDANGCTAMSDSITATYTGIVDFSGNIELLIFPNPSNGEFTLKIDMGMIKNIQLIISNVLGQKVYEEALEINQGVYSTVIDLKNHPAGIYSLSLTGENGTYVRELILE